MLIEFNCIYLFTFEIFYNKFVGRTKEKVSIICYYINIIYTIIHIL